MNATQTTRATKTFQLNGSTFTIRGREDPVVVKWKGRNWGSATLNRAQAARQIREHLNQRRLKRWANTRRPLYDADEQAERRAGLCG